MGLVTLFSADLLGDYGLHIGLDMRPNLLLCKDHLVEIFAITVS